MLLLFVMVLLLVTDLLNYKDCLLPGVLVFGAFPIQRSVRLG